MPEYLHQLCSLLGDDRRKLPRLALLFLLVSCLDLVAIGLLGPYLTLLVNPQAAERLPVAFLRTLDYRSLVTGFGLVLMAVFLVKLFATTWATARIVRFSQDQQRRMRENLLGAFQAMPWPAFLERSHGARANSIIMGASHFSQLVYELLRLLGDAIVAGFLFALLAWMNLKALLLLGGLLVVPIWFYDGLVKRRLKALGDVSERTIGRLIDLVQEAMNGFKEIRILGRERFFSDQASRVSIEHADSQVRIAVLKFVPRHLLELVLVVFVVILTLGLAGRSGSAAPVLPLVGVFCAAAMRLLPIAKNCADTFGHLRSYRSVIQTLYDDTCACPPSLPADGPANAADARFATLELSQVGFRYPGAKAPLLRGVDFHVRSGEAVGLIGRSGVGKTTFLDLLLGLLQPGEGAIAINGRTTPDTIAGWRQRVTYLPQEALLVHDTLQNNITLDSTSGTADHKRLELALRRARLDRFVADLPHGLATVIGPGGVRLSGGQRQRVALARALYQEREVLVLDEITAALDQVTEHEIFTEIAALRGRTTIVVVCHDPSLLGFCDRIYQLDGQGLKVQAAEPGKST